MTRWSRRADLMNTPWRISGYSERTDGRGGKKEKDRHNNKRKKLVDWRSHGRCCTAEINSTSRRYLPITNTVLTVIIILSSLSTCFSPAAAQQRETPPHFVVFSGLVHTSQTAIFSSNFSSYHGERVLHHNSVFNTVLKSCLLTALRPSSSWIHNFHFLPDL